MKTIQMETIELSFTIPGQVLQKVPLNQGTMMVGALLSNHVVLRAVGVDPIHALIEQDESGGWKITDLGSESGIAVNGNQIDVESLLHVGDVLTIGTVKIDVQISRSVGTVLPLSDPGTLIPDPRKTISQEAPRAAVAHTVTPDAKKSESKLDSKETQKSAPENKSMLFNPQKTTPGGRVLEGVAYWGNTILEVEHFRSGKKGFEEVTIGDPTKAHFIAAGKANLVDYTLAKVTGEGFSLRLRKGMSARLRRGGKVEKAGEGSHELGKKDIAHIKYGPVNYFLLYVNPPVVSLPRSGPRDTVFLGLMSAVMLLYVLLIPSLWMMSPKQEEKEKDDIWAIVNVPENMKPKPKPEPEKKEEEKKPEVKLAEVKQPPPPKKTPPPPKPQPVKPAEPVEKEKVKQPKPVEKPVDKAEPLKTLAPPTPKPADKQPPTPSNSKQPKNNSPADSKAGMPSTGAKNPNFKLAGQKVPGKQLGASGGAKGSGMGQQGGERKGSGQTNIKGVEGVDNNKASGVNLGKLGIGIGKVLSKTGAGAIRTDFKSSAGGGGGGSGTGTKNLGLGGVGAGKSLGIAGTGSAVNNFGQGSGGLLSGEGGSGGAGGSGLGNSFGRGRGGRNQVQINIPISAPAVSGGLTSQEVMAVIRTHLNEIRHCYEQLLQRSPSASGKINSKFVINTDGRVGSSQILNSTISDGTMQNCVSSKIERWKFPNPRGGKPVTITYPFVFNPL